MRATGDIRIVVADDQALIRTGIALVLAAQADFEVVGEASDGLTAVAAARELLPDVMVMDLRMPNLDGVGATRQLTADDFTADTNHTVKVLVLTTFDADEIVYQALRAGASGFLLKDSAPANLATAVRAIADGNAYLDPAVTGGVIANVTTAPGAVRVSSAAIERLTPRERQILVLVAHGLSNADIAAYLVLSEATVKTHVCRVLMKLEARDRALAVVIAYRSGLVQPNSTLPPPKPRTGT